MGRELPSGITNWLEDSPLCSRFSHAQIDTSGIPLNARLIGYMSAHTWNFPSNIISLLPSLQHIPLAGSGIDSFTWRPSSTGKYSLKHTIEALALPAPPAPWYQLVWNSLSIPRHRVILWLAVLNKLPTLDSQSMAYKHILNHCTLCLFSGESLNHIFFSCSFTAPIWSHLQNTCGFYTRSQWNDFIFWASHHWSSKSIANAINKLALSASLYHIWVERNSRIFQDISSNQNTVLLKITNSIRERLLPLSLKDGVAARRARQAWDLPSSFIRPPPRPPDEPPLQP
ncbi:uncharacterized protein LOC132313970 [Cornus florida]|uniref:uncharacterized protein LOC132313970 n=1 Tax=Cornus florida TaxID=4283 RepID=UPI002898B301|nr:uncharacterized protein LOC132313970 [Cornus florida]